VDVTRLELDNGDDDEEEEFKGGGAKGMWWEIVFTVMGG
jgi:hypothetical protein